MTEKDIQRKLRSAVEGSVPDVLESLLTECQTSKGKVIVMTENRKKNSWAKGIIGVAAAVLIAAAGITGFISYRTNNAIESIVSLDVNPSIEIDVNKKERVLDVKTLNDDAKKIVGDMELEGSDLDVAVNAIVGAMLREGYISELANSILVSVDNDDPEAGAALQKKLAEKINAILKTDTFNGAVLSQTLKHDGDDDSLADKYGITKGKAQLISQIVKKDSRYTFEQLVPLSINELNLLSSSGNEISDSVGASGTASEKKYIGAEAAKNASLTHAGIAADAVVGYDVDMDYENGILVYEIDFNHGGKEYEYDINASTGEVVKHNRETDDDVIDDIYDDIDDRYDDDIPAQSGEYIGNEAAKSAAFAHAGVSAANARDISVELDRDDGTVHYEVEFESGGYEYSYEIEASSGKILKSERDSDD